MQDKLDEKNFINEGYKKDPWPAWIFFIVLLILAGFGWLFSQTKGQWMEAQQISSPFLQVTNRDLSVFLWYHPEFMRVNAKGKADYLPAFREEDQIRVIPSFAEEYAVVPPQVLFRYHIWHALLADSAPDRKVTTGEFYEFVNYCPEWSPAYWEEAPEDYRRFVHSLDEASAKSEEAVPNDLLPNEVKLAFIGWKNFYKEGEQINAASPTYEDVKRVLFFQPHLARNYWRNILMDSTPNYLLSYFQNDYDPDMIVPKDQLSSMFKITYFNEQQALKGS